MNVHETNLVEAREHAYSLDLEDIDVSHWDLFRTDTLGRISNVCDGRSPFTFMKEVPLGRSGP